MRLFWFVTDVLTFPSIVYLFGKAEGIQSYSTNEYNQKNKGGRITQNKEQFKLLTVRLISAFLDDFGDGRCHLTHVNTGGTK